MSHVLTADDAITTGIFELLCRKSSDISRLAAELDSAISKALAMSVADLHHWKDLWLSFWKAGNTEYCTRSLQCIREQAQEVRRVDAYGKLLETLLTLRRLDKELGDAVGKVWSLYEASLPDMLQPQKIRLSVEIRDLQSALPLLHNRVDLVLHDAVDVLCISLIELIAKDKLEELLAPLKAPSDAEIRTNIGAVADKLTELYRERQLAVQEAASAVDSACVAWFSGAVPLQVQRETLRRLCDLQKNVECQLSVQRELLRTVEHYDDVSHPRMLISENGSLEIEEELSVGLDMCKKKALEAVLESQEKADSLMRSLAR
ncbi:hypothetical protein C8T65DRAFT_745538 [Cerioporus squamosus]|nr:hypothetical protein C8T65DRAFT_745538 [Cerioporus squamosus]